jgi:hypothetical protein
MLYAAATIPTAWTEHYQAQPMGSGVGAPASGRGSHSGNSIVNGLLQVLLQQYLTWWLQPRQVIGSPNLWPAAVPAAGVRHAQRPARRLAQVTRAPWHPTPELHPLVPCHDTAVSYFDVCWHPLCTLSPYFLHILARDICHVRSQSHTKRALAGVPTVLQCRALGWLHIRLSLMGRE